MPPTWLIAALFLLPGAAGAAPLATFPPLEELHETALPYAQERGELQVTLVSSVAERAAGELAVELGLTDDLQLEAGWATGDERELSLGLLYAFGLGELDAAIELEVAAGEQEARLAAARILGGGVLVAAAAGVTRETSTREGTADAHELLAAAAVAVVLPWRTWRLSSELAWRGGDGISWTPGIRWHSARGLELGVGWRQALPGKGKDSSLQLQLAYEFGGEL